MTRGKRVVVSVAGAAGSGKSQLALAVVQVLGPERWEQIAASSDVGRSCTPL